MATSGIGAPLAAASQAASGATIASSEPRPKRSCGREVPRAAAEAAVEPVPGRTPMRTPISRSMAWSGAM